MVNAGPKQSRRQGLRQVGSSFLNLPRLYWECRRKPAMAINGRR